MLALLSSKNLEAKRARGCLSLAGAATSIIFVATKHVFVATKHVFCRDKSIFVDRFCCEKIMFVATKGLSREKKQGGGGRTNTILSRQTRVCRNKTFVAAKMILVAAPANYSSQPTMHQQMFLVSWRGSKNKDVCHKTHVVMRHKYTIIIALQANVLSIAKFAHQHILCLYTLHVTNEE